MQVIIPWAADGAQKQRDVMGLERRNQERERERDREMMTKCVDKVEGMKGEKPSKHANKGDGKYRGEEKRRGKSNCQRIYPLARIQSRTWKEQKE